MPIEQVEAWRLLGGCPKRFKIVPMFNEVFPLAQRTCSCAPRLFRNACESDALGARPGELLNVGNILNNQYLLLASNGTTSSLLHEKAHSLAVLVLAGVDLVFVGSKVGVAEERGVLAEVAHQRTSDHGSI